MLINNNSASATTSAKKAELWLNFGIPKKYQSSTGEEKEILVSLPYGLPVDTMSRLTGSGMLDKAKNSLLEQLIAKGKELEEGEEVVIPLQVRLRRCSSQPAPKSGENPFMVTL